MEGGAKVRLCPHGFPAERQELMDVDGTRQLHFNWQAKVWRYLNHDCEEDEFQEEETDER